MLILVFPPLDFFLARRGENSQLANGAQPIGMVSVIKWSAILSISSLLASIMFSEIASRKGADNKED